jgi:hypothetical protein
MDYGSVTLIIETTLKKQPIENELINNKAGKCIKRHKNKGGTIKVTLWTCMCSKRLIYLLTH